MNLRVTLILSLVFIASGHAIGQEPKKEKEKPAEIVSPKDGAEVEMVEEVEGKLLARNGWPVLLCRPIVGGQPYYAQQVVEQLESDGSFYVECYVGDENTKPGTKYRLVIVIVENKMTAQTKFKPGSVHRTLGKLPQSDSVGVVRK